MRGMPVSESKSMSFATRRLVDRAVSVYFIALIHALRDPAGLAEYARRAIPTVTASKGVQVASTLSEFARIGPFANAIMAPIETTEGAAVAGVSMIKFPDRAAFEEWYYSEEYQAALPFRQAAADVQVIVVEGD